jgi:hypothetical protein
LASGTPEIASLFEPPLQGWDRAFKPKLRMKDVVLKDSMLPRFGEVIDNFVDLCVREKEGRAGAIWTSSLRIIKAQNATN